MSRVDPHAPYRTFLSRGLDEPLDDDAAKQLQAHVAACPTCAAVAGQFEAQRRALRGLAAPAPPRDLWARTCSALDREVMRGDRRPARLALGSLVTLAVVVAVGGAALNRGLFFGGGPGDGSRPTPYAITPQPVTYVAVEHDQLVVYRTQVSETCPRPYYDCSPAGSPAQPVGWIDAGMTPDDLTIGPSGQLVLTGLDAHGHTVFSVAMLPPGDLPSPSTGATAAGSSSPRATTTPAAATPTPAASHRPTPTAVPGRNPAVSPAPTPAGTTQANATPPAGLSPSPIPATATTLAAALTPAIRALPILSDVIGSGAPAAWSVDGTLLAFSAMPGDGTTGSDIYIWRPGEPLAQRLTKDHGSVFASWVGSRILASRLVATGAAGATTASRSPRPTPSPPPATTIRTVLIDPATGDERPVPLDGAWLPSVDPTGQWVIFWQGGGDADRARAQAGQGRLYLAPWPPFDPFASVPAGTPGTSATSKPTAASPAPATRPARSSPGTPQSSPAPTPSGSAAATPADPSPRLVADFGPTPLAMPDETLDAWQVRWAVDGGAYGVWVAAPGTPGSGTLTVRSVPDAADPNGTTIVEAVPALRAYSLGSDRVAWVEPANDGGSEMQIVTWGPGGHGGLRILTVNAGRTVPAF